MSGAIKQVMLKRMPGCRDEDGENYAYSFFRIAVGGLFLMHGIQKVLGDAGEGIGMAGFFTLFGIAGLIEILVGGLIFLGIFSRPAAFLGMIEMLVAYFMVHFGKGINPLENGGEMALLYLFSFLVMFRYGGGKLSLEKIASGKERI